MRQAAGRRRAPRNEPAGTARAQCPTGGGQGTPSKTNADSCENRENGAHSHPGKKCRKGDQRHVARPAAPGEPFDENAPQANRRMDRNSQDEDRVKDEPGNIAARSAEDLRGRKSALHRVDDRDEVNDHAQREQRGARALRDPEQALGFRAHSSPFRTEPRTALLRPEIAAVGDRPIGQRSVQLMWVWQAWQPASPATARRRSIVAASRSSLTSVQARLSAAGPRYSGFHATTSQAL